MKLHRKRIPNSNDVRIVGSDGEDIGRHHDETIVYPDDEALRIVQSVNACDRMREELDAAGKELARLKGKGYKPERTDLRAVCRRSDTCITTVHLCLESDRRDFEWLVLGEAQLESGRRGRGRMLKAYLTTGVTDFEHDSAYALQLPLIGVELDAVYYHSTHLVGYVDPELGSFTPSFHVPRPGYNPMDHEDAFECDEGHCKKDPHIIVPEDHYVPPFDKELFEAVRGKRVEIHIGPVVPEEDEDDDG
jgi:hypothetical protein